MTSQTPDKAARTAIRRPCITRFAPSPTGLLHLGHAYSALMVHDLARAHQGRYLLRIDDIDTTRSRPEYRTAIDEDLGWLGLAPDGMGLIQSERLARYRHGIAVLGDMELTYPCFCTRADIAASASAPHGPDGPVYPGTCRDIPATESAARIAAGAPHAIRLNMAHAVERAGALHWTDGEGVQHRARPELHGDIILARRDSAASYHLSTVMDDGDLSISHVVRGADLLAATDVHCLLHALLGLPSPIYIHHALIAGADGKRLAKRDDAASIASLRAAGADPLQLVADMRLGKLPLGYGRVSE